MRAITDTEREALEILIDTIGLAAVLDAVSGICDAKAEHVLVNWQDKPLAAQWAAETTAGLASVTNVSR